MTSLKFVKKIMALTIVCALTMSVAVAIAGDAKGEGAGGIKLYVATNGNDQWSGRLEAPNKYNTDGPLATIRRARDVLRELKTTGNKVGPATVLIRGGIYYIDKTIQFGPQDSGSKDAPVSYVAYPGEKPELVGGRRITGFKQEKRGMVSVTLPDVKEGKWNFRQLFVDGKRQIRARYPNFDPANPYRGGFLYTDRRINGFGKTVGNIHNPGDWLEYKVNIPAGGEYRFWIYYGAHNMPFGISDMGGRTSLIVDDGNPIKLTNLPDTGAWNNFKWSVAANIKLTQGEHRFRWQNVAGGGLDLVAFALSDDPTWSPEGKDIMATSPTEGKQFVVFQAEDFILHKGEQLSLSGREFSPTEFYYKPGDFHFPLSNLQDTDAEIHIFPSGPKSCRAFKEIVFVKNVDEKKRKITVQGKECVADLGTGDRYFIENILEALDVPGEWYLNKKTGTLYYHPIKGFSEQTEVIAPVVGRLMEFIGDPTKETSVSHIRLAGLTIRATDYSPDDGCVGYGMCNDGVLYFQNAQGCDIEDCTFINIGKYAVYLSGGEKNRISGNEISDSAEGGILLHNTAHNEVSDNHIHHCGMVYKHIGGIVLTGLKTHGNIIAHNHIHDISRYGISLKNPGSYNVIEFNRIQNTNTETYDTGGIEVTQQDREFRSHSIIRNNIVGDTIGYSFDGKRSIYTSWGIYLDSFAGGYRVVDNITYHNSHGGIMLQGGKDNIVQNNIFADSSHYQVYITNFMNNSTGQVFKENVVCYTDPNAAIIYTGKLGEKTIHTDKNLYFCKDNKSFRIISPGIGSFADWVLKGYDEHSLIADPLFIDPDKEDYTLRPDSPAFKLGFRKIDMSIVGPRSKR